MKNLYQLTALTLISIFFSIYVLEAQTTEVGTLPGRVGVSPSGAATYTIPIDLPPGRLGMEPQLSFVYNSQAPSNIMGIGWGISGFSAIGRTNRTLYYNNDVDNVDFDGDQLTLDGSHLIEVGTENGTTIYHTEIDAIAKIVYHPSGAESGWDYFEVFTKNGLIKQYGYSVNSRQYNDDNNNTADKPLFWHLNKVIDRKGNAVKYYYEQTPSEGELHPHYVEYTHYEVGGISSGFSNIVFFRYETLDEEYKQTFLFEKDQKDYKNINNRRLTKIDVYAMADPSTEVRSYELTYDDTNLLSGEYFLKSITPTYANPTTQEASTLNRTTFDWDFYEPGMELDNDIYDQFFTGLEFNKAKYVICGIDVDGDGRSEIVDYKEEYVADGQDLDGQVIVQWFSEEQQLVVEDGISDEDWVKSLTGADFDQDGKDELIVCWNTLIKIFNFSESSGVWTASKTWDYTENNGYLRALPGDFTGDGLIDLLVVDEHAGKAKLFIGTGSEPNYFDSNYVEFSFSPNDDLVDINSVADFNGDGKQDIALEKRVNKENASGQIYEIEYDIEVYSFNGSNFGTQPLYTLEFTNESALSHEDNIFYVDVNGDGRSDVHHRLTPKNGGEGDDFHTTWHSFGNGFIMHEWDPISHETSTPPLFIQDMNNDGRADWVYLEAGSNGFYHTISTKTYHSFPNGLPDETNDLPVISTATHRSTTDKLAGINFADINGNGTPDVVVAYLLAVDPQNPSPPQNKEHILMALPDNGDLGTNTMIGITDGMGVKTTISYQASRLSFSGFDDLSYPLTPGKTKNWNIKEHYILDDNNNKLNYLQYSFHTPVRMCRGKGFMGYMWISQINYDSYTRTDSYFKNLTENIGNEEYGYILVTDSTTVETLDDVPVLLMQDSMQYDLKFSQQPSNLVCFPVVTQSTEKFWDNDDNHSFIKTIRTIQDVNQIDNYGNSLERRILVDKGQPTSNNNFEFETKIETDYTEYLDVSNWLVSRVGEYKITKKKQGEDNYFKLIDYDYEQGTNLVRQKTIIPNGNNDLSSTFIFEFDQYGNTEKQTHSIPAYRFNNKALSDRIIEFDFNDTLYDGRFLTSVKQLVGENGFTTQFEYDQLIGATTKVTSADKLFTTFESSPLTTNSQITNADGTETITETEFNNGHPYAPIHHVCSYFTYQYAKGKSSQLAQMDRFTFYDKLGRLIREVYFDIDEQAIFKDYYYNDKGLIDKVSEPYYYGSPNSQSTKFTYDKRGRLTQTTLPNDNKLLNIYHGNSTINQNMGTLLETVVHRNADGSTSSIIDHAGSIQYEYYSTGLVKQVDALGAVTTFSYDDMGQKDTVFEPNLGQIVYEFNPFGEIMEQIDARGNTFQMNYDNLGRLTEKQTINTGEKTNYYYNDTPPGQGETGQGFGKIKNIIGSNGYIYGYLYDDMSRLMSQKELFPGGSSGIVEYYGHYSYDDDFGRLKTYTYPTGFAVEYEYATNGSLVKVKDELTGGVLWENLEVNERGQIKKMKAGNTYTTDLGYDDYGFPSSIVTDGYQDLAYKFDPITGNLLSRTDNWSINHEDFTYDGLTKSRLESWTVSGQMVQGAIYGNNGNIQKKSGVTMSGDPFSIMLYGNNAGPHAVTDVVHPVSDYQTRFSDEQIITYTPFNKVETISILDESRDPVNSLYIEYGPDEQRKTTQLFERAEERYEQLIKEKRFILGNYEEEIDENGTVRKLHYLNGGNGLFAIYEWTGPENHETKSMYYILKDYLGSYETIVKPGTGIVEKLSFDPWGRRRNPTDWSYNNVQTNFLFDRGYTGHEHLEEFSLINMNGRVYDQWLGRFLSPDPFLQAPGNLQNYNRYSYVLNNPLKYTDPTGYRYGPHFDGLTGRPIRDLMPGYGESAIETFGMQNDLSDGQSERMALFNNMVNSSYQRMNEMYTDDKERKKNEEEKEEDEKKEETLKQFAFFIRNTLFLPGSHFNPFFMAEAIAGDVGVLVGGVELDKGGAFILAGDDAGKFVDYTEGANGFAPEAGTGIDLARIDYTGEANDFKASFIYGERKKAWLGVGAGVSASFGIAWSNPYSARGTVITTSISVGFGESIFGVSGGYNFGWIY